MFVAFIQARVETLLARERKIFFFVVRKYQSIGISTSRQTVRLIKRRTSRAIYNLHQFFLPSISLAFLCSHFCASFILFQSSFREDF